MKIDGKQYALVVGDACNECVADHDNRLCTAFGSTCTQSSGRGKVWKAIDEGNKKV